MKKLLFFLSLVSIGLSGTADNWQATEVLTLPGNESVSNNGTAMFAYDKNQSDVLLWSYALVQGKDITYYILDENLEVSKQFTLKGVFSSNRYIQGLSFLDLIGNTELLVSKGIFTDDGKWCVTITDFEVNRTYIYNEDGTLVGVLPGEGSAGLGNARLIQGRMLDGNSKIFLRIWNSGESVKYYSFTGSSGVAKVAESKSVNAYPNPVRRGEALTVSLPKVADANTTVSVMDLNGILVYNGKVAAGTETVAIPTDNLPLGILLYSISSPVGKPLTGKICVE